MKNKIIIIAGYPASGKTTFAKQLSEELNIPYFNLDSIKSAIGEIIKINSWEESKSIGNASFLVLMYILESFMKVNKTLIIENSFIKNHEVTIEQLIKNYEYEVMTYILKCDLKLLHKRFIERENALERDNSNKIFGIWNDFQIFERDMKPFDEFNIGNKIININTNDLKVINNNEYKNIAKEYLFY
jgi:predicted kinase